MRSVIGVMTPVSEHVMMSCLLAVHSPGNSLQLGVAVPSVEQFVWHTDTMQKAIAGWAAVWHCLKQLLLVR